MSRPQLEAAAVRQRGDKFLERYTHRVAIANHRHRAGCVHNRLLGALAVSVKADDKPLTTRIERGTRCQDLLQK